MQFDFKVGRESKAAEEEKILQAAVEKSEKYTAYVDKLLFGESRGAAAVAAIVTTVVPALTTAGLNIWGKYGKLAQQEREGFDQRTGEVEVAALRSDTIIRY